MTFEVLAALIAAVTIVATALLLFGRRLVTFYTSDAVAPLRMLADKHEELRLVGWEPVVKGRWRGCEVHLRVILEHGAAERFDYQTGPITRIEIHVPDPGEAASAPAPPIPEDDLPDADTVAVPSADSASLFAAPMGLVFEMQGTVETVADCEALLDRLADIAER